MAYFIRPHAPGTVQHLIGRFASKEFRICGDTERREYLRRAAKVAVRVDLLALAYALMSSHIHWATLAGLDPPGRFVSRLHGPFARWLNIRQSRSGHVFMERFTLLIFEGEIIADLLAYIHNNPVRAGVVADPADSSWTSHRYYIGDAKAPPWLRVEQGLALAGFDASASGRLAFHEYVRARAGLPRDDAFSGALLNDDRSRVRHVLGSAAEAGAGVLGARGNGIEIFARRHAVLPAAWNGGAPDLLLAVSRMTGLAPDTLRSRSRRPRIVRARRLALVAWSVLLGRRQSELLALLGLSSAAGSKTLAAEELVREVLADANELVASLIGDEHSHAMSRG
jgi:hypothetical protein